MSDVLRAIGWRAALASALFALVLQHHGAAQQGVQQQAVVETDRTEYVAGETVAISGRGFSPFETVALQVVHADGTAEVGMGHEVSAGVAGSDGAFNGNWTIDIADIAGGEFLVAATGETSGRVEAAFRRAALIQTDKLDYQPGETALISGSGFAPLELVTLQVTHSGGVVHAGHLPFGAWSDEKGDLSATWFVDPIDSFGKKFLLTALGGSSGAAASWTFWDAGAVSLTTLDTPYTQDFNTLAITGTSSTVPVGWDFLEVGTAAAVNGLYTAGAGSSATGDTYSFGAAGNPERALGGLQSGTFTPTIGAQFTNNTGATITSLDIAYTGEQWRFGATMRPADRIDFQYSLNATTLATGTWTDVDALDFTGPTSTPVGALDGNSAANRTAIASTLTSLNIPNGLTFWIRWNSFDAVPGADDGLAVDNFSLTPHGVVATPNLSIDDVSMDEGDSGTTTFTFTVSLSAPAPAGGVTFDIATANGSATSADGDYAAKTLTSQTIAESGLSYTFAVEVNGDVNLEPDQTFFVNVSNVTGANVTDGQGQGTIVNDEPTLSITDVSLNEGTGAPTTFTFTVNLSRPARSGGVTFNIATADGTATAGSGDYVSKALVAQSIAEGMSSYPFAVTVNGDATGEPTELFSVNVTSVTGAVEGDLLALGTILNDDVVRIRDIQGAGHISPFNGQPISSVPGIVTGLRTAGGTRGFYLQDPSPDANEATSEGVFVFTGSTSNPAGLVSVGNAVLVSGAVSEFRPGGTAADNPSLTITEIVAPGGGSLAIVTQSTGNALPAPIVIGTGGRMPPTTVIEDDAAGNVETSGVFDAANDGIDFYESLEGMRVQIDNAVAVGRTNDAGSNREIPVVGDGFNAGVRTARGGVVIQAADFNPERIILNDLIAGGPTLPPVNVGDSFPGATIGFMDYSFGNFKLEVASLPALATGGLAQESTTAAGINQVAIATFNVENLSPADPPAKFATLAAMIVTNLRSPDIVALEEIQDNNGATNNSVTDATTTYNMLIAAIQAAGGPTYQFRQIDPVDDQDGGEPGGNIRQGFLFRSDRGLAFIDRAGGTSTSSTGVAGSGAATQLTFSPGRIDPTNAAFTNSRKPLAGEFTFNGHRLFVIANHFNSKGGDDPLFGRFQPPNAVSEAQRHLQAQVVHGFVNDLVTADPNANVVVLGDINDFQFSGTMDILTGVPAPILIPLIKTLPLEEQYSYVFEGNSQALDHILISQHLFTSRRFEYDIVHVNSEFAVQASDHDPQIVRIAFQQLTSVGPAKLWIGLKNSDAVGLRLDIRAEMLVNDIVVASGVVTNSSSGSSGFNNALLQTIPMTMAGGVDLPRGTTLALRASVRRTCFGTGHNSGTARLWFNGQAVDAGTARDAGSRLAATVDASASDHFLRSGFVLSDSSGAARQSVDAAVNSAVGCAARPFVAFGTWTTTVP